MATRKSIGTVACALIAACVVSSTTAFASTSSKVHHHKHTQSSSLDAQARRTPADSFLVYKVYSIDQLIAQVKASPAIQAKYARHFRVPQSRVVQYMRANLVESYIPDTGMYTCYCVRKNGLIYPVKQKFTEGTKVFALRNGEPVLKWVCGNPLSKFLPAVETHTIVRDMPVIKLAPSTEVVAPTDNVQVLVPTESQTIVTNSSSDFDALVPQSIVGAAAPEAAIFVPSVGAPSALGALAALPVLFIAGHGNGGGGTGGGTNGNPLPVPEASTVQTSALIIAFGAFMLGLRRRLQGSN